MQVGTRLRDEDEMDDVLPGLNEIESAARLIYQTMPATPHWQSRA